VNDRILLLLEEVALCPARRYNVYLRKPKSFSAARLAELDCGAVRSAKAPPRVTENGEACVLPFRYCKGGCNRAGAQVR